MNYLGLTFWPSDLAIFYPLSREAIPYHLAGAALLLLLAITAIVFTQLKSQPYLAVGWFWYLGTLVPVIGLIQVGSQSMADRYTYLPHIGLFLALVWGVAELVPESMRKNAVRAGLLIVSVLVALTFVQVGHWRDSITLWTQAVRSVPHASFNLHKLGESYDDARSFEKAEEYYQRAIDREGYPPAAMNLALLQYQQGRWREAEVNFHIHAKQRERRTQSRRYLGKIGLHLNEYDKAIENLEKVVEAESARFADTQLPPTEEAFDAAFDLALAYFLKGEPSKGLEYLEKTALAGAAAQIISRGATPGALRLVATLGWLSAHSGQQQRATKSFEILDDLTERDWREAFLEEARGLANLDYDRGGNPATAVGLAHLVCEADPEPDARHLSVLGLAYLRFGQPRTALQYLEQATTLAKAKQDKELLEILEKLTRDARHE
jgi:tetratricopeptide (TPR) repeat protein